MLGMPMRYGMGATGRDPWRDEGTESSKHVVMKLSFQKVCFGRSMGQ